MDTIISPEDIDKLRDPSELPHHWELRRKFISLHNGQYTPDRLVCLSHVFVNVECLGLTYPDAVMQTIKRLGSNIEKPVQKPTIPDDDLPRIHHRNNDKSFGQSHRGRAYQSRYDQHRHMNHHQSSDSHGNSSNNRNYNSSHNVSNHQHQPSNNTRGNWNHLPYNTDNRQMNYPDSRTFGSGESNWHSGQTFNGPLARPAFFQPRRGNSNNRRK